jgi:predicted ATP-grasp superfamily ATP-dependent carboligase
LGLTRQLVGDASFGATGFRYCGNILAPAGDVQFGHDTRLLTAAITLADVVAQEFELVGVGGIDFVARDGVPVPIEVNPRYSASMELVEQAYGVSVFGAHAAACATGVLPEFDVAAAREPGRAYGKAILFARHDVVCGDTRPWLDEPGVRDVPHPGEQIPAGRPACTVFATGVDAAACYASLVRRAERVYEVLESWSSVLT